MILTPEQIQYWRRWSLQSEPHVIASIFDSHELQRAEIEQLNSRIQQIAASHQSNTESLLEVARERDAVTAELARVTKELERAKGQIVQGKKLYDLTLNNELRWMRKHEEIEQQNLTLKAENAELRADRERLDWLAGEMDREKEAIALGKPIPRSLFRSNCPITRATIDTACEGQKSADEEQGGAR